MAVHIVPVSTYDPPSVTATLNEFCTLLWLKIKKDFMNWIEGEDYDIYAWFPTNDYVPFSVWYVIMHDAQETMTSAENKYIHSLKHHSIEGMPWLGNILILKHIGEWKSHTLKKRIFLLLNVLSPCKQTMH